MQNPLSSLSETSSAPTNNYNNETLGGDTKLKYLCENKAVVAAASYMPSATQEHSHMSAEKSCCRMLISLLRASSVDIRMHSMSISHSKSIFLHCLHTSLC